MLELILVRHGETEGNKRKAYLGWTDMELSIEGEKQADAAGNKLAYEKIDVIYSSPLKRALATAEIINRHHGLGIRTCSRLKEQNFGSWENHTHQEVMSRYPEEYTLWMEDWINHPINGGETALEMWERVTGFIDFLLDSINEGTCLIVSHQGSIRMIIAYLLGMGIDGIWRFKADNGSISRICIDHDKFAWLVTLNG